MVIAERAGNFRNKLILPIPIRQLLMEGKTIGVNTLDKVITTHHITGRRILACAPAENKAESFFPNTFGRDTILTFLAMMDAYNAKGISEEKFNEGVEAFLNLKQFQGQRNEYQRSLGIGKIIHEHRFPDEMTEEQRNSFKQTRWHFTAEGNLESYETVDATILLAVALLRLAEIRPNVVRQEDNEKSLKMALEWGLRNIHWHKGFPGYTYNEQVMRRTKSLRVQGLEDSDDAKAFEENNAKPKAGQPINLIEVAAEAYEACMRGEKYFAERAREEQISSLKKVDIQDYRKLSSALGKTGKEMKIRFNDHREGFLMLDDQNNFLGYAEGIATHPESKEYPEFSHKRMQLKATSVMQLASLYFSFEDESGAIQSVFEDRYIVPMIRNAFNKLYKENYGLKSTHTKFKEPTGYHRGDSSWVIKSLLAEKGMRIYGQITEAMKAGNDTVRAIIKLGTARELYTMDEDGEVRDWKHPSSGQMASKWQAWSAAFLIAYTSEMLYEPELEPEAIAA